MSFWFENVKEHPDGVTWPNGDPLLCVRCEIDGLRRKRATVTAYLRNPGTRFKVPVAYCPDHVPAEVAS